MDILEQFTRYIQQIGYSKGSQYQIPSCIKEFLEVTNKTFKSITQQDILDFYQYLQTRPLKRRTGALSEAMIAQYVFSLKTFFNWLEQTGQIKYNPISNIRFKSPEGNPREPLSQKEIQQLFEAAQTSKETAILHLFYSCGLRRTEAENLNTADIHFSKNLLYVREGKGAKRRAIPINEKVKNELESYYNHERTKVNEEAFMLNRTNQRMSGDSYNRALKKIIERTEINKETTLHHLRHSIATHLLENGLSIEFVRDFLGHSHLEATQIYAKVKARQLKNMK
ncbi:MAG: tyrosine-type recombinase/integrase [Cytophagaceae bacterium]